MNDKQEHQTEGNGGGGISSQPNKENDNTIMWVTLLVIGVVIASVIFAFL